MPKFYNKVKHSTERQTGWYEKLQKRTIGTLYSEKLNTKFVHRENRQAGKKKVLSLLVVHIP